MKQISLVSLSHFFKLHTCTQQNKTSSGLFVGLAGEGRGGVYSSILIEHISDWVRGCFAEKHPVMAVYKNMENMTHLISHWLSPHTQVCAATVHTLVPTLNSAQQGHFTTGLVAQVCVKISKNPKGGTAGISTQSVCCNCLYQQNCCYCGTLCFNCTCEDPHRTSLHLTLNVS